MSVTFSQFCTGGPEVLETLRRCIDDLGRQGQGYEFPDCRMPEGCVPRQVALGFLKRDRGYLLYWRPAVAYQGRSPVLSALFARSVWRFDSYEAMTARLASLRREAEEPVLRTFRPPVLSQGPAPVSAPVSAPLPSPSSKSAASPWPPLYQRLREELGKQVLGQDRAVEAAAFRLYSHAGKRAPARPLSLIFHGPTGVGKSELGKALAPALERCCARRWQFVWTELNTFTQPHSVHRLTGAPPGYVGYEDQPIFEAVRSNPCTVFMFDELEKAHPEVLKVFMSILDEGRCTARQEDSQGSRELDFRRCVFLFTTNTDLSGTRRLGFVPDRTPSSAPAQDSALSGTPSALARQLFQSDETARQALARSGVLREITGRFSGLVGFRPLDEAARVGITAKQITALAREYGLNVIQVAPDLARALTPQNALSPRSAVPMLEGVLSPIFLAHTPSAQGRENLRLSGSVEHMCLTPI